MMLTVTNTIPCHDQSQPPPFEITLLFLTGVGATIGYTAILSNLVFYTEHLGESSFIYLNLAVHIPFVTISIFQANWDEIFDKKYKKFTTCIFRGSFSYALAVIALILTPRASNNLIFLSTLVFVLGTTSAILVGSMRQLSHIVYPESDIPQVAISLGMQGSALLSLVVTLATGFGDDGTVDSLLIFTYSILGIKLFCWIMFYLLLFQSNDVRTSLKERDTTVVLQPRAKINTEHLEEPLILDESFIHTSPDNELSFSSLWNKSWIYCMCLILTLTSSNLVTSTFNRIPSEDPKNEGFPQVIFYTKMISDFVTRPSAYLIKPKSEVIALILTALAFVTAPVFLLYLTDVIPDSDFWLMTAIILFSCLSAYVITACFQLAPEVLSTDEKVNTLKQSNLLSICFNLAALFGLLIGLVFYEIGF